jgi:hypothetical protein
MVTEKGRVIKRPLRPGEIREILTSPKHYNLKQIRAFELCKVIYIVGEIGPCL